MRAMWTPRRSRRSRRLLQSLVAAALLAGLLAGCGDDPSAEQGDPGDPQAREATPQAIAAAVLAHYDQRVVAVAPLFARDGVKPGQVVVELAFARESGEGTTHINVVVSDDVRRDEPDHDPAYCSRWECVDVSTAGNEATAVLETGYPEEDPGLVAAWSVWGDHVVIAYAHGPFVDELPDAEVTELRDALVEVVTDPAVGPRTSAAYAEAGDAIPDDVWREWYGQGNGSPKPDDYRDWR